MNEENIRKYVGQKVLLVLKNNFKYTVTIPKFTGNDFTVIDKFGREIVINCEMVSMLGELEEY